MLSRAPAAFKRALRPVRARAGEHPLVVPFLLRLTVPAGENARVTRDTDVVIEGFPRSGNSFATNAFAVAAGEQVRRTSNTHLAGQVGIAVAMGRPTLVLIRRPADAVASLCVAAPYLRPDSALREWLRFHRVVARWRSGFVLATFDQVTADFGEVMRRVNAHFGTAFPPFVHTAENVALVQRRLEDYGVRKRGYVREQSVPRPSVARHEANRAVRNRLATGPSARLLASAEELYERLTTNV